MVSPLKKALDARGLPAKVLRGLDGIHYTWALHHYRGDRQISAKHAILYEQALGIPRSELRPDFWPPEIYDFSKKKPVDALPVS